MILKKRGQGAGKWNVPGGKVHAQEEIADAARRETEEETGIRPLLLKKAGILEFYFPEGNSWSNVCTLFIAESYTGKLQAENEECSAHWVSLDQIPYEKMWDSDARWMPLLLAGKNLHRVYSFDRNDRVMEEKIFD